MSNADVLRARAENIVATMIGDPQVFGNLTDAITQALLASQDAGLEMAATVADAECERILSKQSGAAAPALQAEVDKQIRMTAMMLPEVAERIRALKARPDAEPKK